MYNAQKPDLSDLPSTARLLKSTVLAAIAAALILITVVLPAEYGIDPTGVGSAIGLTEMGEIKSQLAEEAEMDHQSGLSAEESFMPSRKSVSSAERSFLSLVDLYHLDLPHEGTILSDDEPFPSLQASFSLANVLLEFVVGTAHAQDEGKPWTDDVTFTLEPGEGIEYKLVMQQDAEAEFLWSADGGRVNFDLHGDGDGKNISYEKGRGSVGEQGILTAKFTGNHGWFWRNRDKQAVTVTLQVRGDYEALVRK